jgi:hypothetical protein
MTGPTTSTGTTNSTKFPTTPGAYQETNNGGDDTYVVKLNATGSSVVFGTYIGGAGNERGGDIKLDPSGAIYLTGRSSSDNFPTLNAYDSSWNGLEDVYVAKLNPAGSSLIYSTLLGGSGNDNGLGIAVDANGAAYITGYTQSTDFPTLNAYQADANGSQDAFAFKLDPTGKNLGYATYLGGAGMDEGRGIVVNTGDEAYVVGFTQSSNFPASATAYDSEFNGDQDAFLIKLNSAGSAPLYGTYLGGDDTGAGSDSGDAIAIDRDGKIYVTGEAGPEGFPTTAGPSFSGGDNDSFAAIFQIGQIDEPTFTISGTIRTLAPDNTPVAGITVSAGSRTTTTNADGFYQLSALRAGSYTVQPSKAGYEFNPQSAQVTLPGDATQNFVITTQLFTISGRVTSGGGGLPGVTISDNTGVTTATDNNGNYSLTLAPGIYTLTPARDNYVFTPPSLVDVRLTDQSIGGKNFTASLVQPPKPQYLSLVARIDAPKYCDKYEPNNDLQHNATTIVLDQLIEAKICEDEGAPPGPDSKYHDDFYVLNTTRSTPLKIRVTLPENLWSQVALKVTEGRSLSPQVGGCYKDVIPSTKNAPYLMVCAIPEAGEYTIWLYSSVGRVDNENEYTLQVTQ